MSESYIYIGGNALYYSPEVRAGLEYLRGLGEEEAAALFDKAYNFGPAKFSDGHGRYFLLTYERDKSYRISLQE
ncbi:MAG: hypothetical protein HYW91_00505 [Candidatus Sungbacteria bacterium]|nr:hypothetical protein [Candidatus Sungbacteria bacterium]